MAVKLDNPFLVTGYESPEFFCDRAQETEELMTALQNGQNVTLTAPRRMGKTGLIWHLFHQLNQKYPHRKTLYIDLFSTESLADFTSLFASTVLGQLESTPQKLFNKASSFLKGLRPNITIDEFTGRTKIGFDIVPGNEAHSIAQVFNYLKESGKECYLAFDEFQQIAEYPEKNVEALLRSHIQNLHNVHFIFSGSRVHMLSEMFLSPKRPFYQSTTHKSIGAIDEGPYYAFAAHFFAGQGRSLPDNAFHKLYQKYDGHTWYMQKVLNKLYEKKTTPLDEQAVMNVVEEILKENEYYYQTLLRAYTKGQSKLLKAIANEQTVKEITSGAFISKYGLTATSSVNSALKRLVDDEIVYSGENGYMIYDRFFGDWLQQAYHS